MRIAIRADASSLMGTGHVMRCLTLADGLKARGGAVRFVVRHIPDFLCDLILEKEHGLTLLGSADGAALDGDLPHSHWLGASQEADSLQTLAALSDQSWDWLVVDHYALDRRWEATMREAARRILVIDDLADRYHDCDLLLDQNLYPDMDTRYEGKVPLGANLLLGPRYALLRKEFCEFRKQAHPRSGPVRRILIFFGGVDTAGHTQRAMQSVADMGLTGIEVDVVIGAQHPFRAQVEHDCVALGFHCHVQTGRMAELMSQADFSIGAAGSATWERCCLGLPCLAMSVAANQTKLLDEAGAKGLVWAMAGTGERDGIRSPVGRDLQAFIGNEPLRRHMSLLGLAAVDGRGITRVAASMGCLNIELRPATSAHARKLFEWRNHPAIREVSRDRSPISWEMHEKWLSTSQDDPSRDLLIGSCDGLEIGVVRFDISGKEAEVSIYLAPETAGQGAGRDLLLAAERWILGERPGLRGITAEVLGDNRPSHGLFSTCGYTVDSTKYSKRLSPW